MTMSIVLIHAGPDNDLTMQDWYEPSECEWENIRHEMANGEWDGWSYTFVTRLDNDYYDRNTEYRIANDPWLTPEAFPPPF